MGNQIFKESCCTVASNNDNGSSKYNDIDISYTENIDYFESPQRSIPNYKNKKHSGLVNYLNKQNIKFTDNDFPTKIALGAQVSFQPIWKRISSVYPGYRIVQKNNDYSFDYIHNDHSLAKDNFVIAMKYLKGYPQLIDKIFPVKDIREQGFYALYFGMEGNIKERTQIVIDDFIPLNRNLQYLFGKPNRKLIWMILIEKALAKVVRSYHAILQLTPGQIFEEITGVPLLNPNKIVFHRNYFINSSEVQFPHEESKFFKFTIDHTIKVAFLIWEGLGELYGQHRIFYTPLVLELINEQKVEREYYVKDHQKNKLILSKNNDFLTLSRGTYIIHIYNRSSMIKNLNLMIYASERIDIHLRKENYFQDIKKQAIFNVYRQKHNNLKPWYEMQNIAVRFYWDGHRGILCIKNEFAQHKKMQIRIQPQYEKQIIFEEYPNKKYVTEDCKSQKHIYVYFLRRKDREIGRFYKISVFN